MKFDILIQFLLPFAGFVVGYIYIYVIYIYIYYIYYIYIIIHICVGKT